ncbi:MAG: protein DpdE [Chloroflexi bacterium]|nr:protein DpdE [Chloroflexota bacterium]
MEIREAQRGRRAGGSFWGCAGFPECRGSRDLADGFDVEPPKSATVAPRPQAVDRFRLKVGGFVWTYDRALLGKLVDLNPGQARVRIVHSAANHEEREYDPRKLRRAFLSPQTRVYVFDDEQEVWSSGRVIDDDPAVADDQLAYVVRLPGQSERTVLESELEARCFAPTLDPTSTLATGGLESQFFADRRLAALRACLSQQSASAGADGLVSASVELLPHQLQVVRRVREDPIQRFLLADEVGLGKTIEAGAVIRQTLSDVPSARVTVVAPTSLLRQWEQELRDKFDIDPLSGQVEFCDTANIDELHEDGGHLDLLVVDEAHHLIRGGGAVNEGYDALAVVAHRAERLLLLTATPVLGDDAATIALLHLLDRATYPLEDIQGFRSRREQRQRYGELVLALDPGAPPTLLGSTVAQIADLLPHDPEVKGLCATALDASRDSEERQAAVHNLRYVVSDTYRLDHRLIRTRRVDAGWPDRSCPISAPEVDIDPRVDDAVLLLEQWRRDAASVATADSEAALARLYIELLEALGRGLEEYSAFLKARLGKFRSGGPEAFTGEREWLQDSLGVCHRVSDGMSRVELCVASLKMTLSSLGMRGTGSPPRIVVFASSSTLADALRGQLEVLPGIAVTAVTSNMDDAAVEDAVSRFVRSTRPAILVADRTAEEGLNLQTADALLLADLPFAPERLEQRIGRLDRLGRRHPEIPTRVVLPSNETDSPWLAWHELLRDGYGVFSRSISDVHFLLEELQEQARLAVFRRGSAGLADLSERVAEAVEEERRRQDREYALERLDLEARDARDAFDRLKASEQKVGDHAEAIAGWLFGALGFGRSNPSFNEFRVRWRRHTQVPERPWRERFDPALERPLTFSRAQALSDARVRLVRPGFSLTDEMLRLMRRDDRGTAFATWRTDSRWRAEDGDWLGFRLTYVLEIDEDRLRDLIGTEASIPFGPVRSAANNLFAPWTETRDYDAECQLVSAPLLTDILERPYDPDTDLNLAGRPDVMESAVGWGRFSMLCHEMRSRSEELLRSETAFATRLDDARTKAVQALQGQRSRLDRRQRALKGLGETDPALGRMQVVTDALLQVATAPRLRLEAIGAFVVSQDGPRSRA